jgi:hypothetical protein
MRDCRYQLELFVLANLIANDATDDSTTDGPHSTATGQHRAANRTSASTNRGIFTPCRHPTAPGQPKKSDACRGYNYD